MITTSKLDPLPDDRPTQDLWRDIARNVPLQHRERYLIKRPKILLGPTCSDLVVLKVFLHQSVLHRAIARQPRFVQGIIPSAEVDTMWSRTLDDLHTWRGVFELLLGPTETHNYKHTLIEAYAVCMATGDPFSLQHSLEKLGRELFGDMDELIDRTSLYLLDHPERGFFRDAAELALEARFSML